MTEDSLPAATAARDLGVPVAVVRHERVGSLAEAAALRGQEPRDLVKTMVVRLGAGEYVLVLVPGDRQISWPRLRAMLEQNRLSLAAADEAFAATGYRRGTITPFGTTTSLPVIADASIRGRRISLGAGEPGAGLVVDADTALTALDARVGPLTEDSAPARGPAGH
ncbi:MAG: aminoacyl-tRNA deacylase [Propioniciclava sp.]